MSKRIPRSCKNHTCSHVFLVPNDDYSQFYHSEECRLSHDEYVKKGLQKFNQEELLKIKEKKERLCRSMASRELTEEYGMEDGEHLSNLKKERPIIEQEKNPQSSSSEDERELKRLYLLKRALSASAKDQETTTTGTKKSETQSAPNGEETTQKKAGPTQEGTTTQIESDSLLRSNVQESKETPLLGSNLLLMRSGEEERNSILSLNESSEYLMKLAEKMNEKNKNEIAPLEEIKVMVRCLESARNIQKTKLEYLKLMRIKNAS